MRYINQLAASVFEALGGAIPPGGCLRVLEAGAGTGGTTSALLRVLPGDRRAYRFTDVSDVFLERARTRFAGEAGLDFGTLDLDAEPEAQGYQPGTFDVIVAANAVHAVKHLPAALERLRRLLAPSGMLVLVESTVHLDYFDMTTGLIEGWQHFADDVRGDNPLLSPSQWAGVLTDAGFHQVRSWPETGSPAAALGQHVIVAQAAGSAPVGAAAGSSVVAEPSRHAAAEPAVSGDQWADKLEAALPSERLDLLRDLVRTQVMAVLRLDPGSPPSRHDRLMDLGMDSLMAVQLRNRLTVALALGRPLPSSLIFDYPTIDGIAGFLLGRLAPDASPIKAEPRTDSAAALGAAAVATMSDEEIARLLDDRLGSP